MSHKSHLFAAPEKAFLVNSLLLEGAEDVTIVILVGDCKVGTLDRCRNTGTPKR